MIFRVVYQIVGSLLKHIYLSFIDNNDSQVRLMISVGAERRHTVNADGLIYMIGSEPFFLFLFGLHTVESVNWPFRVVLEIHSNRLPPGH